MTGTRAPGGWHFVAALIAGGLILGLAIAVPAPPALAQATLDVSALARLERQAEANVAAAVGRLALSRELAEAGRQGYESGALGFTEYLSRRAALVESESVLALARIDVEEIAASSGAVRRDFTAPTVAGRDFIGARLEAGLAAVSAELEFLDQQIRFATAQVNAGVRTPLGLAADEVERVHLAVESDRLRESIVLRQQFLAGDIGAEEAEIRYQLLEATARQSFAATAIEHRQELDALMDVRYRAGIATIDERNNAASALLQLELDAEQARFDVDRFTLALAQLE